MTYRIRTSSCRFCGIDSWVFHTRQVPPVMVVLLAFLPMIPYHFQHSMRECECGGQHACKSTRVWASFKIAFGRALTNDNTQGAKHMSEIQHEAPLKLSASRDGFDM